MTDLFLFRIVSDIKDLPVFSLYILHVLTSPLQGTWCKISNVVLMTYLFPPSFSLPLLFSPSLIPFPSSLPFPTSLPLSLPPFSPFPSLPFPPLFPLPSVYGVIGALTALVYALDKDTLRRLNWRNIRVCLVMHYNVATVPIIIRLQ